MFHHFFFLIYIPFIDTEAWYRTGVGHVPLIAGAPSALL